MVERGIEWRQNGEENDRNGHHCHHGRGGRDPRESKGIDVRGTRFR